MNLPSVYNPISRQDHYNKMQMFLKTLEGLPPGRFKFKHIFADNTYLRELSLTKGTFVVSGIHLKETSLILMKGSIKIFSEDGLKTYKAPKIVISQPGTQRIILALEDTTFCNVFSTRHVEVDQVVREITSDDKAVLEASAGRHIVYVNGVKTKDEEFKPSCEKLTCERDVQRLLSS